MKFTVIKNAIAKRMAHAIWTQAKLSRSAILPALRDIADVLIADMKQEFSGARRYTGDMASGFGQHDINADSVGITQSAAHELFIREGTVGPYKGFPAPVVTWAMARGYSRREAFRVAKSIQKIGTAKNFVPYHPAGQPRFEYPEWVINEHAKDMPSWAKQIGQGVVSYITTGDTWRARKIG